MRNTLKLWRRAAPIWRLIVLILGIALTIETLAQTRVPSSQDNRSFGVDPNASPNQQNDQSKSREGRPELVLQTGYNNFFGASRLVFSPDDRLLATGSFRTNTIKLWETASGRELRDLSSGGQNTTGFSPAFDFSPDNRLIAIAASDNSIAIWDLATGLQLQRLTVTQTSFAATLGVGYLAFTHDGKRLISLSDSIRIWDTSTWREAKTIEIAEKATPGLASVLGGIALSSDGSQLAQVEADHIKIIDLTNGKEVRSITLPSRQTVNVALCFTPDGHLLAAGIGDKKLTLWEVTNKLSERFSAPTNQEFSQIRISPDGRLLALAEKYTVKIWDTSSGQNVSVVDVPNTGVNIDTTAVFLGFSADGKKLATGGFGTQTLLWDPNTARQIQQMKGRTNPAYSVNFSADGTQLTSGGRTRWDLRTGQGRRLISTTSDRFFAMPSPNGKLVALFAPDQSAISIVDASNGGTLRTLSRAANTGVERVYFSPDSRLLAATYMQNQSAQLGALPSSQVVLWDVGTARELQTLTLGSIPAAIVFNSDSKTVATVAGQGETVLWDVATGSRLRSFSATATPNLTQLGNINPRNPATFPNLNMGDLNAMMTNVLGTMSAGTMGRSVTSAAFSPDGKVLASAGVESKSNFDMASIMNSAMNSKRSKNQKPPDPQDYLKDLKIETSGQVVFWDTASGQQLGAIKGHGRGLTDVAFSRDGKMIATSATDNTIKLWDAGSQHELRTLSGHTANVESMDFSPDGRLLASAADDGSTFLWDVNTGEHLLTLISLDDGGEWMVVTPEGLFDGTPQSWNQILWRYNHDTFNVAPVEWFFNEFYYPGLLSDIIAGKRPRVAQDISKKDRRQPIVKLSLEGEPAPPNGIATRTVRLRIDVMDAAADADHSQGSGARDLRLFRNGSLVKVWHGDALKGQQSASFEEELTLVAGPNRLSAYAFNRDNVKSKDANLLLNGAESLKRAGTAWLIVIGVNEYANAQYNLKYAVADAQSFAEELQRQQTRVAHFDHVEVVPLLNQEATKTNILSVLARLTGADSTAAAKAPLDRLKRAEPEDAVIIYFAGHGTAQGQRFYLIPHDLGYSGDRSSLNAESLKTILAHSISDQELEDAVEGLAAGSLLMVIDACNSGQALEAEEKRRGPMNSKGLAQLAYEKGMYILTAAQSYQAALEAAQLGHGLLTYALIEEGLKTGAADSEPKDGVLSAREWLDFATERVPQMQQEKMKQGRGLGLDLAFTEGEQKVVDPEKRSVQRPRVFYRREIETEPLVIAKPGISNP